MMIEISVKVNKALVYRYDRLLASRLFIRFAFLPVYCSHRDIMTLQ